MLLSALVCGNTQTFVKINDSIKVAPSNQQQISAETPATLCGESRSPGGIQQKPKLQGVPKVSSHFVFAICSGSGARTEELLTFIQQPWKFAT